MTQLTPEQQQIIMQMRAEKNPNLAEDVIKSGAAGGVQGAFGATPMGLSFNIPHLVSEGVRAGAAYLRGDDMKRAPNPIPTSNQVLDRALKPMGGLYEPKTTAGEFARTTMEFVGGGKVAGGNLPKTARPSVKQLIGGGLASETAGQLTEGTPYEVPARLIAGYLGGRITQPKQRIAAANEVKRLSSQKYAEATQKGGIAPASLGDDIANTFDKARPSGFMKKAIRGKNPELEGLVNRMQALKGKRLSFEDLQELDEELSILARDPKSIQLGARTEFGRAVDSIQDEIRLLVNKTNVKGVPAWREAQKLYSASKKLDDVEQVIYRAELMRNPQQGLQTGFRRLAENARKKGGLGYTEKEIKLLEKAAKDGGVQDVLRSFGSRLAGIFAMGSGDMGTTAAVTALSKGARTAAERSAVNQAAKLQREISKRAIPPSNTQTLTTQGAVTATAAAPSIARTELERPKGRVLTEEEVQKVIELRQGNR